jgi:hypothetical protein
MRQFFCKYGVFGLRSTYGPIYTSKRQRWWASEGDVHVSPNHRLNLRTPRVAIRSTRSLSKPSCRFLCACFEAIKASSQAPRETHHIDIIDEKNPLRISPPLPACLLLAHAGRRRSTALSILSTCIDALVVSLSLPRLLYHLTELSQTFFHRFPQLEPHHFLSSSYHRLSTPQKPYFGSICFPLPISSVLFFFPPKTLYLTHTLGFLG